jgi:hypothetical protein
MTLTLCSSLFSDKNGYIGELPEIEGNYDSDSSTEEVSVYRI